MKVITDEKKIDELLTRGVENVYPNKEALKKVLMSGRKIKLYLGIDPTGGILHLGHLVQFLKLKKFQDLGHEVVILIGDFTAQIGDPTDKQTTRKPLTHKQVVENAKGYKKQISKILDLKKLNMNFVHNAKWTNKLSPEDMLELASNFTVSNLLSRSMFQERLNTGREVHVHEFLYPIFQAYDAVTMDVDLQIGGNDQMFNMLAGRDLMRRKKHKEMFVLTTKLLVDPTGKKMGKTEGNMITLNDSANNIFGKIMSWPDSMIASGFEIFTGWDLNTLQIDSPRDQKMKLAHEVVKICQGEQAAREAEENFINTFQKKEIPVEMEEIKGQEGELVSEVLVKNKILSSKGEWRRLCEGNGVHDLEKNETIADQNLKIDGNLTLKIGKKRFIKITAK
ncbi:tyrosine--tRNA ligase [Candidatus Nomurabacteria bacterium RIFCSPHIGHO2_01_FULL_42_15]|uniref:Tyrosine--tRNA ligase n=1 Tax=Candidatus Nomurabacteria bacterium RIFCSPHIGHO2_01_FULL_42_15 TaxID=1801742 RepID=A0A1F6VEM8_9BACT|nr:MAG: tyrosine--tRNA ligase [Candidatus Nomurabacteria bacterium RIFCSPHIGHO2_01_FULL_42_15]OGI92809.1 MAG: tyrosine--tRNA ligase [Candidatus Nomurabacteria bacterium RIFCSPLOWO2_01_FULL_41_18]